MVLDGGQFNLAHKVSQVGGKQAPFRIHFTAAPGKKQVQDTIVKGHSNKSIYFMSRSQPIPANPRNKSPSGH